MALQAQVGINTPNPKATLDVVGKASDADALDGIIPPRLKGVDLKAKTYTLEQQGAIVYVTTPDTNPSAQTMNVTSKGYYYFDGSSWQRFSEKAYTDSETVKVSGTSFQRAALTGDVTAEQNSNQTKVTKIQGSAVSATAPVVGQLLVWNGTQWTPTGGLRVVSPSNGIDANGKATLEATDNGGYVYVDNTTSTTVEVPDSLPLGFSCVIVQNNTGQVTVLNSASSRGSKTRTQHSAIGVIKSTNTSITVTGDAI
ncbi:hypothetical protein B739_1029 [Riemerella anatipestifer RA-CH-1]|uniref:Uncharacterized protein n=3 Tax=Riemerella anatipestifer TaxID=34085 RepID=J9R589_RIEAN|nr:hypothetical protein B739_1029 [Riemerella anatipestifer RA-CH-1]AQY21703.1 hypothetical protein AB406_0746 [Riemerella anatipestifer]